MELKGKLVALSPLYRGNARKTLFTRDGDGKQRLVSLPGEIQGTAEALMEAFTGQDKRGRNKGLFNRLWERLYNESLPKNLLSRVNCSLEQDYYPKNRLFDMRMGIKLDEDRWAAEANANYKLETLFKNSVFDFKLSLNDKVLKQEGVQDKIYYLLEELRQGRFWFGAGKTKGLGRCLLKMELPFKPQAVPEVSTKANHLRIKLGLKAENPIIVRWPWGHVEESAGTPKVVQGQNLIRPLRSLPEEVKSRLEMGLSGPTTDISEWKNKLEQNLPKVIAYWLKEGSARESEQWFLPREEVDKLSKGKHPLSKKVLQQIEGLIDKPFSSYEEASNALQKAIPKKNMVKRVLGVLKKESSTELSLDSKLWQELTNSLGVEDLQEEVNSSLNDLDSLEKVISKAISPVMGSLHQQLDRQLRLLQSDAWVDQEIEQRQAHLKIKKMILEGKIREDDWEDPSRPPEGIKASAWSEFLESHSRVKFQHMANTNNLQKSIANDENHIEFLKSYRQMAQEELAQPYNTDFRFGGVQNRQVSQDFGKPFDKVFNRMLTWTSDGKAWQLSIPASTLKGAFRKRASQVLKTIWGESGKVEQTLKTLFGAQGQKGGVYFFDALLDGPEPEMCSMDGTRMDPTTGRPVEQAKFDILYACGQDLKFDFELELQDLGSNDLEAFEVLKYLIKDLEQGDIAFGGEKTSSFGWCAGLVKSLEFRTTNSKDPVSKLLGLDGEGNLKEDGIWRAAYLSGDEAAKALWPKDTLVQEKEASLSAPVPKAKKGFVSHRAFGGYCGKLVLEGEVLTPLHIKESGEPRHREYIDKLDVNGWDAFSISSPYADKKSEDKTYAIPSKSLKGNIRHLYTIASDSIQPSTDIGELNPADSLFGWVGQGQNQSLAGRLVFDFARFQDPEMAWFKVPFPYGHWHYKNGAWKEEKEGTTQVTLIAKTWRLFPHRPLAPIVKQLDRFEPDEAQATYFKAVLPGSKCSLSVRFWNLEQEELERLIWCLVLEQDLAHKLGKSKYLGFGSLRFQLTEKSYLMDFGSRYSGKEDQTWKRPFNLEKWLNPKVISYYQELKEALYAGGI